MVQKEIYLPKKFLDKWPVSTYRENLMLDDAITYERQRILKIINSRYEYAKSLESVGILNGIKEILQLGEDLESKEEEEDELEREEDEILEEIREYENGHLKYSKNI